MRTRTPFDLAKEYLYQQFYSNRFKKKDVQLIYKNIMGNATFSKKQQIAQQIAQKLVQDFHSQKIKLDSRFNPTEADQYFEKYVNNKFKAAIGLNPNLIKSFVYKICDIFHKFDKEIMNQRQLRSNQEILQNIWNSNTHTFNSCICSKFPDLKGKANEQKCYKCSRIFHPDCFWPKQRDHVYECPFCFLRYSMPQKQIKEILFMGYLPKAKKEKIQYKINFPATQKFRMEKNIYYEARCVKFNSKNRFQLSWPDSGSLSLNKMKLQDFKPLQKNSPLKRRPDQPIKIEKCRLGSDNQIMIDHRSFFDFNYRQVQVQYHLIMIAVVKDLQKQNIVANLQKNILETNLSKNMLKSFFHEGDSDDIDISKISISLSCQFFASRIKKPSRSVQCSTHFQVFDLQNFIVSSLSSKSATKKWKCPICDRRSYDLVMDNFVLEIMNKQKNSTEIIFNKQCQPVFIQNNYIQNDSEQQQGLNLEVANKGRKINNLVQQGQDKQCMVIDLESDNQVPPVNEVQQSDVIDSTLEVGIQNNTKKNNSNPNQVIAQLSQDNVQLQQFPKRSRLQENSKNLGQSIRKLKPLQANIIQDNVNVINIDISQDEEGNQNVPDILLGIQQNNCPLNNQKKNKDLTEQEQKQSILKKTMNKKHINKLTKKKNIFQRPRNTNTNQGKQKQKNKKFNQDIQDIQDIQDKNNIIEIISDDEDNSGNNDNSYKARELREKLENAHKLINAQHGQNNTVVTEEDTEVFQSIYDKIIKMTQKQSKL